MSNPWSVKKSDGVYFNIFTTETAHVELLRLRSNRKAFLYRSLSGDLIIGQCTGKPFAAVATIWRMFIIRGREAKLP